MRRRLLILAFGILLLAAVAGMVWTSDWLTPAAPNQDRGPSAGTIVDQRPLQTAQRLASLATTPEEQSLAQEALRTADQEVDLAFTSALRDAMEHPPVPTAETRKIDEQIKDARKRVQAGEDRVAELNKKITNASGSYRNDLQQELELVQAQLHLDENELSEAHENLIRAGGDKQSVLQRMLEERQAAPHQAAPDKGKFSGGSAAVSQFRESPHSLIQQIGAWSELRSKQRLLAQARGDALNKAAELGGNYKKLETQITEEKQKSDAGPPEASARKSAVLADLKQLSGTQKGLTELGKRAQAQKELSDTYARWMVFVKPHQRAVLYTIFQFLATILLLCLLVVISDVFVHRYFENLAPDRRRLRTLRNVVRFALQALGVFLILLVIVGPPNQLATVLALAGAGLTVALKDFIVGFFGWFVLMGRNGIRLGDWVEINGVGGEVVEIDLLHTVLLETGNRTDAGHPTGRRVSFVNSYAIEGHYFNFSTSGQWLWDEVQVLVPLTEDPNAIAQTIQQIVASDTETNVHLAEQEWRGTAHGMRTCTAAPTLSVRPTGAGIEITVRYITRASERYEVRSRLYQQVVGILQQKRMLQGTSPLPANPPDPRQ
jgi:small-conductance mechanosensitive channel